MEYPFASDDVTNDGMRRTPDDWDEPCPISFSNEWGLHDSIDPFDSSEGSPAVFVQNSTDRIIEILHEVGTGPLSIEIKGTNTGRRLSVGGPRQPIPLHAKVYLLDWLDAHADNPYPSCSEWDKLERDTCLTRRQIRVFLVNNRSRYLGRAPKRNLYKRNTDQNRTRVIPCI